MIHKKLLSLLVLLMTTVSMSAKFAFPVTLPTGNSIMLDVTPNSTIGDVKVKIQQQTLIPTELQIITLANHELNDEQSLSQLHLTEPPTLSLVSGNYYLNGGSTQNCTVSFKVGDNDNVVTAQEDDVVTVTFTPTAPYVLTAVTAQAYTTWAGARRAEPEPTPTIPVLGDIELTPVQGQANTYTFTMPPSHVKFTTTLLQEYEVDLTVKGDDDQGTEKAKWTGKAGEQGTAKSFPIKAKTGQAVTISYNGRRKVKSVTATIDAEPVTLATPLTIEAITAGTIVVNITDEGGDAVTLETGIMKYSRDGGTTKTPITQTTNITVAKGDKVQFYGNGTDTQVYGNYPEVKIQGSGDGFQTKVYGNIMSLLDETGFATKTELPNAENAEYVFYELFAGNTTLIDASELLLPATKMAYGCYEYMFEDCTNLTTAPKLPAETLAENCYEGMFLRCTSLTTAPKLPATTLATKCYAGMFNGCTSLTNAYVKAAYTNVTFPYSNMFKGCTATGAVLHTTLDNKDSWQNMMGPGKTWENWSVADDWQE